MRYNGKLEQDIEELRVTYRAKLVSALFAECVFRLLSYPLPCPFDSIRNEVLLEGLLDDSEPFFVPSAGTFAITIRGKGVTEASFESSCGFWRESD